MTQISDIVLVPAISPPNAGKGTQIALFEEKHPGQVKSVVMGDMLREIASQDSELGREIKSYIDVGKFAPLPTVLSALREGIGQTLEKYPSTRVIILDGFPRDLEQAQELQLLCQEWNTKIAKVLYIDVKDEECLSRAVNRRYCKHCNKVFNLKTKPFENCGKSECDGQLIQRKDDVQEIAEGRLNTFHNLTDPILPFYKEHGVEIVSVDGQGDINDIAEDVERHLAPVITAGVS
ncbi:MAG: nucleoside monophosphate kinase [Vampirovibrio sp.]|nr:nucleoside monophosphate kinase [Vampirovibrio sp.]